MALSIFTFSFMLSLMLMLAFFLISKRASTEENQMEMFECGYTGYFFTRYSYSIHYFMVSMIFLFLDMELCLAIPLFSSSELNHSLNLNILVLLIILFLGLITEWLLGKLEWSN